MNLLTLAVLCISLGTCSCLEFPRSLSIVGDNVVVLLALATFGTISLIGACAFCFRKKKTFEKLENEGGSPENLKKNEYPIFRALATDITESSAIVPCERNNLSRDNLLNSSDNLTTPDHHHHEANNGSLRKHDVVDSSDVVVLLDKSLNRDRTSRDTITFETEKKHQHSPSSKTPLLYAKNVQSYQEQPPVNEQMQQKSVASSLFSQQSEKSDFDGFYNIRGEDAEKLDEIDDFINKNSSDNNGTSSAINPFFNSTSEEFQSVREVAKDKDDTSEIESSINDNSEKYQILEEETDGEDIKIDDSPAIIHKNSDFSASEDKSVEEALKALDLAIGFGDDDSDEEIVEEKVNKMEEIKEEATFLVDSIVNDCEKILEEKEDFNEFLALANNNMSTPCAAKPTTKIFSYESIDIGKVLFPDGVDCGINDATFPMNETYEVNDKTFDAAPQQQPPTIKIEKDKEETSSEDLTTVTPVNTPIELSYSSETWDQMSYSNTSKGAISKIPQQKPQPPVVVESETPTFNQDGWYLHPQNSSMKNDTFDIYCDDEETDEGNMEDMSSTFDQLRRQLTEMLPHAQGMSVHNDFMDDDDEHSRNKDSSSPSDNNYGIKYGDLDEASNAATFDMLINPEPVTELNINYHNVKRPLSPIMEESECDETCRTFVCYNETKLLDSTSTGMMESASASDAGQMGQVPKALMASNDTLFNFEDTLSDQTDNLLMSPRMNTAGSSTSSTLSRNESHDRISLERTPTNEDLPKIGEFNAIDIVKQNIRQHPLSLDLNSPVVVDAKYELAKAALEEGSWPLELPEAQQIINDLSSPEQNPTADSLSFEQDITYAIDDQKTCVSLVLKNDEERISEISEPLFASEGFDAFADDASSLQIDDAISLEIDDNCNLEMNDENGNQNGATKDIELVLKETSSMNYDNDSINPGDNLSKCEYEIDSLEPEARILNDEIEADSIPGSHATKSVISADSIIDDAQSPERVQSNDTSESNSIASPQKRQLDSSDESDVSKDADDKKKVRSSISLTSSSGILTSLQDYLFNEIFYANENGCGCSPKDFHCNYHDFENDQWASSDIRQVSCNNAMMSTSFTKEWSDDDSSHSSEEFMYVKGTIEVEKITSPTDNENSQSKKEEQTESGEQKNSENMDFEDLADESTQATNEIEVHSEDEESESEFVPSCWDQSLQPSKSSLKSPEREGSVEHQPVKSRRRVAFKIQRYHSVYEYPSEVVQLSPAYSEPQLWSNYDLSGNIDFFTYTNPLADLADNFDGFSVSSSSRPFHNNTHNIQVHNTWPNETTDFSWSQYQDNDGIKFDNASTSSSKIEWPSREDDSGCMCESTDSPSSLGELNHQKNSLRLPLELISSTCSEVSDFMSTTDVITKDLDAVKIEMSIDESPKPNSTIINVEDDVDELVDDDEEKMNDSILPTPLSGSIDSLSSSSHSASTNNSSPPSFTTFGKETILKDNEMCGKTQTIIFIEEDVTKLTRIDSQKKSKSEAIEKKGGVLLQSSDDDSGFENVVQIKCEK